MVKIRIRTMKEQGLDKGTQAKKGGAPIGGRNN